MAKKPEAERFFRTVRTSGRVEYGVDSGCLTSLLVTLVVAAIGYGCLMGCLYVTIRPLRWMIGI